MNLNGRSQNLLEQLVKEAPNMKLIDAYRIVEKHQEMQDTLSRYEFTIMGLLDALGVDSNGNFRDETIVKRFENMPDEFWGALRVAIHLHGSYACSPFTPVDWRADKYAELFPSSSQKEWVNTYKEMVLSILKKDE